MCGFYFAIVNGIPIQNYILYLWSHCENAIDFGIFILYLIAFVHFSVDYRLYLNFIYGCYIYEFVFPF